MSEDDWNAIQETLYLNSMSGMTESIVEGANVVFIFDIFGIFAIMYLTREPIARLSLATSVM